MTVRKIKKHLLLYLVNHFLCGTRFFSWKRSLLRSAGFEIGDNTKIVGPVFCTGTLKIGDACWIGRGLTVHGNGTVVIADRCDLAPDVTFLTGGHRIGTPERRAGAGETYHITVGNGVWIGAGATVLGNTEVRDGSVIAACACVTTDVPEHTVAGGVPAKVIKELDRGEDTEKEMAEHG